ncbi:MAG TPA: hypothetical protein VNI79_08180 [Sphingomicrobium sp.]|nr:hypothetical protein [Sphingomicrobium sp.]
MLQVKADVELDLIRVVEISNLESAFVICIEQAGIDSHLSKVFAEGLPVGSTPANWTMVNADHSIAPDIGFRLAGNAHLARREISHTPRKPTTKGTVTVCNPLRLA